LFRQFSSVIVFSPKTKSRELFSGSRLRLENFALIFLSNFWQNFSFSRASKIKAAKEKVKVCVEVLHYKKVCFRDTSKVLTI